MCVWLCLKRRLSHHTLARTLHSNHNHTRTSDLLNHTLRPHELLGMGLIYVLIFLAIGALTARLYLSQRTKSRTRSDSIISPSLSLPFVRAIPTFPTAPLHQRDFDVATPRRRIVLTVPSAHSPHGYHQRTIDTRLLRAKIPQIIPRTISSSGTRDDHRLAVENILSDSIVSSGLRPVHPHKSQRHAVKVQVELSRAELSIPSSTPSVESRTRQQPQVDPQPLLIQPPRVQPLRVWPRAQDKVGEMKENMPSSQVLPSFPSLSLRQLYRMELGDERTQSWTPSNIPFDAPLDCHLQARQAEALRRKSPSTVSFLEILQSPQPTAGANLSSAERKKLRRRGMILETHIATSCGGTGVAHKNSPPSPPSAWLPTELLERIVDFAHVDLPTLCACALTSRALLPTSKLHLRLWWLHHLHRPSRNLSLSALNLLVQSERRIMPLIAQIRAEADALPDAEGALQSDIAELVAVLAGEICARVKRAGIMSDTSGLRVQLSHDARLTFQGAPTELGRFRDVLHVVSDVEQHHALKLLRARADNVVLCQRRSEHTHRRRLALRDIESFRDTVAMLRPRLERARTGNGELSQCPHGCRTSIFSFYPAHRTDACLQRVVRPGIIGPLARFSTGWTKLPRLWTPLNGRFDGIFERRTGGGSNCLCLYLGYAA
jgi:hypothetical protein